MDKPMMKLVDKFYNKGVMVKSETTPFDGKNFAEAKKILDYLYQNKIFVNKYYAINEMVKYMVENDKLPDYLNKAYLIGHIRAYSDYLNLDSDKSFQPLLNALPKIQGSVISLISLWEKITDAWFTNVTNSSFINNIWYLIYLTLLYFVQYRLVYNKV